MKRSSGVRTAATVAVSVLTFALATGCGGDSGGSDAKALSAAELKKAIIAQGDVDGYKVDASGKQLPSKDQIKSTDEKCRPLAYAMSGLPPADSAVSNTAVLATQDRKKPTDTASKSMDDMSAEEFEDAFATATDLDVTVVGLSSYDGSGAEETFKSVSDAVGNCSGGFPLVMQGEDQKLNKITEEKASGAGDESVAFTTKSDLGDGDVGTAHVQVVRHGATIATYYTMNLGLLATDKPYDVPAEIIDAQATKLK
ncbi:hypothetical protein IM697_39125 [Streptomyces ferrugineus]|uniref:Lipoprotein n=1 Tax=Streptomyces ferrugineus TaxID=1413221 RepID=A0A7M2SI19_9ACTN|nr:hypothetical protein [Streptomyces ferrugineus]QOV35986.1 hypothetical protein IM697_39125 [Streptomyces ferrugineus]